MLLRRFLFLLVLLRLFSFISGSLILTITRFSDGFSSASASICFLRTIAFSISAAEGFVSSSAEFGTFRYSLLPKQDKQVKR